MPHYFMNRNTRKVHRSEDLLRKDGTIRGCLHPPAQRNQIHLGYQFTMDCAVRAAKRHDDRVSACADCESDLLASYLKQFSINR